MTEAATIRRQIEATLANRIPSALTPAQRTVRPVIPTGIEAIDELLDGGLPLGAITEIVGPECSGRTSVAQSFLAQVTQAGKVCAWIDVSNTFDPESTASNGVDLSRLLWVRCGAHKKLPAQHTLRKAVSFPEKYLIAPATKKGLHGGGFGFHPRNETKGLSEAVSGLFKPTRLIQPFAPLLHNNSHPKDAIEPYTAPILTKNGTSRRPSEKPWTRIDQGLRTTDLLLQAGGCCAIVLDMGSVAPEYASRVALSIWFRFRAAAEKVQVSVLLLTQCSCAKSSAALLLQLQPGKSAHDEATVFTGMQHKIEVIRQRFTPTPTNVVPLHNLQRRIAIASWTNKSAWASTR